MDEEHCVIAELKEFARFKRAADKRCYTSFLMSCHPTRIPIVGHRLERQCKDKEKLENDGM